MAKNGLCFADHRFAEVLVMSDGLQQEPSLKAGAGGE
jgi:hypothetical protein